MITPFTLMDDICNRKTRSLAGTNEFADFDIGKYMFNRWLSMTNPKNALVASEVLNSYYTPDDKDFLYEVATLFAVGCRKVKYIKKDKQRKPPEKKREWGEFVSEREKRMYSDTLDFLEEHKCQPQ